MDIKAYIDSGILEQFVLGNTSQEESVQIMELSKAHPEIKAEIEAIEETLLKLAESYSITPSSSLKDKVMAGLNLTIASDDNVIKEEKEIISSNTDSKPKLIQMYRLFVAASVLLFGVSLIGNILLYTKLRSSQTELANLDLKNSLLTENNNTKQSNYLELKSQLSVIKNIDMKVVELKGLPLMPDAKALVYLNPKSKEVYFSANILPPLPDSEIYQLWAIVEGKPVDEGVIYSKDALEGVVKMKNIDNATAFAITIEKKGGSVSPNLEKMVMIGNVI